MAGVIQGTFGWDNSPFVQGMQQAEVAAQRSTVNIENKFQSLFKRTASLRAEHAVKGFATSLAGGDVSGAISGLAEHMTGLGLAAGIGVGVAVGIFTKLKGVIDENIKKHEAFRAELGKPLAIQQALAPEEVAKQADAMEKVNTVILAQNKGTWQSVKETWKGFVDFGQRMRPGEVAKREVEGQAGLAHAAALRKTEAQDMTKIVNLRATALTMSEREGEISKVKLARDEKIAALRLESRDRLAAVSRGDPGARKDPNERTNLAEKIAAIEKDTALTLKQYDVQHVQAKEKEISIQEKLLKLQTSGFTPGQQQIAVLQAKITANEKELSKGGITEERKAELQIDTATKKEELLKAQYGELNKTPEQKQVELAEQNKFRDFAIMQRTMRIGSLARQLRGEEAPSGTQKELFGEMSGLEAENKAALYQKAIAPSLAPGTSKEDVTPEMLQELTKLNTAIERYWGA
jgi:hypothetical protein